jgi:hypothetical protein
MSDALRTAEILSIGDELIHGSNLDTNARWLAQLLERHGVAVARFTVVGDDPVLLEAAMRDACTRADLVVATGGGIASPSGAASGSAVLARFTSTAKRSAPVCCRSAASRAKSPRSKAWARSQHRASCSKLSSPSKRPSAAIAQTA